jgi:hypothetical protein
MDTGILYIATGKKYVAEALESAKRAKHFMPHTPITLITDIPVQSYLIDTVKIIDNPSYSFRDKVLHMGASPYQRTIFLDTDTYLCEAIDDLFILLDRFDIGLVHDSGFIPIQLAEIPDSFPQFNSGVICFRQSPNLHNIFTDWIQRFNAMTTAYATDPRRSKGHIVDEVTLRAALYHGNVRIAPLTSQYNCRFIDGGCIAGTAKILHAHSSHDFAMVEQVLNRYTGKRIYIAHKVFRKAMVGMLVRRVTAKYIGNYQKPYYRLVMERTRRYIQEKGFIGTVQEIIRRILKR